MTSYAAMKRRFTVGTEFTIAHSQISDAARRRVVVIQQTNAIASTAVDPTSALDE